MSSGDATEAGVVASAPGETPEALRVARTSCDTSRRLLTPDDDRELLHRRATSSSGLPDNIGAGLSRRDTFLEILRLLRSLLWRKSYKAVWEGQIMVLIVVNGVEIGRTANLLLDPGSPLDVIGAGFLTEFPGVDIPKGPVTVIGGSFPQGKESVESLGTIDIRWYSLKGGSSNILARLNIQSRVEDATCHVVETNDNYDLVIGRSTIDKLQLFTANRKIFAAWRGAQTSSIDSSGVERDQDSNDAQVQQAEQDKKERERKKKLARKQAKDAQGSK
ncbi:hypothetical protein NX059_009184 [Plenodomus lindquistii]|nr:hypothetical protein NX059_009184 [Plenodomus lindquistii]